MRNLIAALALLLATTSAADAGAHRKPHARARETAWMRGCIHERTGPVGGVSLSEARTICKAEQPDDEVEAAKLQLTLAKLNAKVLKAKERARKALDACGQAVTDRCVETADPVHGTDCNTDEGLHAEYVLVCLGQEGK